MKFLFNSLLLLLFLIIFSCNKEGLILPPADPLIGYWVNPEYAEKHITFQKAGEFNENGYGIAFLEDGIVIERTSGWCGTPPLHFSNLEGTWTRSNDIIDIMIPNHWMGDIQWEMMNSS